MPEFLDWRTDDPRAILQRVVECLRDGKLVALPTEAGYDVVASAMNPAAMTELASLGDSCERPSILLGEPQEVFDWLPHLRGAGVRLPRAFWPGPLTLSSAAGVSFGAMRFLPSEVVKRLVHDGSLALRLPDHAWPATLARHLGGPMIAAPLPGFPQEASQIALGRDRLALIVDAGPSPFVKPATLVQIDGRKATVIREGAVPRTDLEDAAKCRIVFVCTGNTCRSPLAEALCRTLLSANVGCAPTELATHGYLVQSAGMAAGPGNPATSDAVDIAREYGADLSRHESQPLSLDLLSSADLVFTMTWNHLSLLHSLRAPVGPKPQLLAPTGTDVDDPIGGSEAVYRACASQIWQYLNDRLPEMLEA